MSVIANSAVLVRLNISVWGASKRNKELEHEVARNKNADPKAMRMYDNLMVGSTGHSDIHKHAADSRLWHTTGTNPFDERGYRLCPTSLFLDYKLQQNQRRDRFWSLVDTFRVKYFSYRETAEQYRGDMFNALDYPSVEEACSKFAWNFTVAPVPESGHICIDLPEQELAEVRASCDAEVDRRVELAMQENEARLKKELKLISGKCSDVGVDEDDDTRRWHDTFVTNPLKLCELLKHTNLTQDPQIEEARSTLEELMRGKNKEMFKDSPHLRAEAKSKVDSIIDKFDW
jgi:hypothetical protein